VQKMAAQNGLLRQVRFAQAVAAHAAINRCA